MDWANEKPWHQLGVDVDSSISSREMVYKLKLDFEVSRVPSGRPKSFANQETFQFFKSFTEHGEAPLETIGTLDNGRILWALAPLNEEFTLKEADQVKGYLLLASRNENRETIEIQFTTVRAVGSNTLQITSKARTSFKNICRRAFTNQFPFMSLESHKFEEAMIRKTKEAIGLGREAILGFATDAERLANKKVDGQTANRYMFDVFQPETVKDLSSIGHKEIEELAEKKTRMGIEAITRAPGQDLEPTQMTAWGLLNAVTYTIDHQLGNNQDSRLRLAWFGPNAKIKKRAFDLALELL